MKQSRTGRCIRQMMPAAQAMCVAVGYVGGTVMHWPLVAWVLVEDAWDQKDHGVGSDQDVMPVYLDEGVPRIIWPSSIPWQDGRVDVHTADGCEDATRALRAIMEIQSDSDPAVTP